MSLAAGANFGPYRIIEPLGRGGMASVYRAYEPGLDRYVALKVLPAEFLHDPTFAERFRREAKVVARLEHPNIIPIFAFDIEGGVPWMAMRLIAGGSLSGLLKPGPLAARRAVDILAGAAAALDYAHGKGVVHRDVKPQNILLDEHERVYLADFGIARMVEGSSHLTQTGMISGTPQYMAPEQATAQTVDHRADIYALGIVAYELLTGRVPFAADTPVAVLMKHVQEPMPLPDPARVPEPLARAVLKCTSKKPGDRWPTATGFVEALRAGLDEAAVTATGGMAPTVALPSTRVPHRTAAGVPAPPSPARPRPWAGWLAAAAAVAIALGSAGVWLATRQRAPAPPTPASSPAAGAQPGVFVAPAPTPTPLVLAEATPPAREQTPGPARAVARAAAPAPAPESPRVLASPTPEPASSPPSGTPAPAAPAPPPAPVTGAGRLVLDVDASQDPYGAPVDQLFLEVLLDGRPLRTVRLTFPTGTAFARSRGRQRYELSGLPPGEHRLTVRVDDVAHVSPGAPEDSRDVAVTTDGAVASVTVRERRGGGREVRIRP
jgi:predicted Ser/Thr protein kinase